MNLLFVGFLISEKFPSLSAYLTESVGGVAMRDWITALAGGSVTNAGP